MAAVNTKGYESLLNPKVQQVRQQQQLQLKQAVLIP